MKTYVLIHGAWHGAWCWDKVIPLLRQAGHQAIAVDLPGHGGDKTPFSEITLRSYTDRVCQALDRLPEPVILVGHSLGGLSITQSAEYRPDKINKLVYLCAFVPQNGQSLQDLNELDPNPSPLLKQNRIKAEDGSWSTVKSEAVKEIFYHDCSAEDIYRAQSLLCPEPSAPKMTSVRITMDNYGRIPRIYIQTLEDRALSPAFQEKMFQALPFQQIIQMKTGHSPFFSVPGDLANHLLSL